MPFHLSGGEKRRIARAGALAMRPEGLPRRANQVSDPRGRATLVARCRRYPAAKIIASHDLEFIVATCPRGRAPEATGGRRWPHDDDFGGRRVNGPARAGSAVEFARC